MVAPFDLHVLSTPPAFILSQDQTLELKISAPQNSRPHFRGSTAASLRLLPAKLLSDLRTKISLAFFVPSMKQIPLRDSLLQYCLLFGLYLFDTLWKFFSWIFRVALLLICQGSLSRICYFSTRNVGILSHPPPTVNTFFINFLSFYFKHWFFNGGFIF